MRIEDKLLLTGAKSLEDSYINKGFVNLFSNKMAIFSTTSGLSDLISPPDSAFNSIKQYIGPFLNRFTNSFNIIQTNKKAFFEGIFGFRNKIPEDLL